MGFLNDFFGRHGDDATVKRRAEADKKRTTVQYNSRYDQRRLDRTLESMEKFNRERSRLCDSIPTGNGMTADAFFLMLLVEPKDVDNDEIRDDYWLNAFVRDKLRNLKEYQQLRTLGTVGDELNSALAFCTLRPTLEELWDETKTEQEMVDEMRQRMQQLADLLRQQQQVQDDIDALDQQRPELGPPEPGGEEGEDDDEAAAAEGDEEGADGGGDGDGSSPSLEEIEQQLEQLRAQMEQLQQTGDRLNEAIANACQEADDSLSGKEPDLERKLAKGAAQAGDEVMEMDSAMQALGWGNTAGAGHKVDYEERMRIAKRLENNPDLLQLAKRIGRNLRVLETEIRRDAPDSINEVRDVEVGDDIERLLAVELSALRHPRLRKEALCRLEDREMLQLNYGGDERVGLGSLILCTDQSLSMQGRPQQWATGIEGAFMLHAREADRGFLAIHFGSEPELREFEFSKDTGWDPDRVLDMFEHFFGGGTNFMAPLSRALDHLQDEHARTGVVKGDIVFITDGLCDVRDAWLEDFKAEQERLGFHVFGIRIGGQGSGYADGTLDRICDGRVVNVFDLSSPDEVREIFAGLHRE